MAGNINPNIPTIGQPNSTEAADIVSSFETLRDALNAVLNSENKVDGSAIAKNSITPSNLKIIDSEKLMPTAGIVRGSSTLTLSTSFQDIAGATLTIKPSFKSNLFVDTRIVGYLKRSLKAGSAFAQSSLKINSDSELEDIALYGLIESMDGTVGNATQHYKIPMEANTEYKISLRAKLEYTGELPETRTLNGSFKYMLLAAE